MKSFRLRTLLYYGLTFVVAITTTSSDALAAPSLPVAILPDGRRVHVINNNVLLDSVGGFIVDRVADLAASGIAEKGAFSMSIGSGTTVAPLAQLSERVDISKVHLFFGNERTEGEAAGKCAQSGAEVFQAMGIPEENVHRVPLNVPAEEAAEQYEALLRSMPKHIVGQHAKSGLPSLDLCLLGSGADGHCASLYPKSSQVTCSPGCPHAFLPAEGKGGITLTIDAINAARHVILSAGKPTQSDIVRKCLGWSNAAVNTALPAGMIATSEGAMVEWILTPESAADLPAL